MGLYSSPWVLACVCGLALTLWAEYRDHPVGVFGGKLVAATAYLGLAWQAGALLAAWSRILFAGMVFCWLGDLLLVSRMRRGMFLAGLGAFLVGHLLYSAAFLARGLSIAEMLPMVVLIAVFGLAVRRWLHPHLDRLMNVPVHAYLLAIMVMWTLAMATHAARPSLLLLAGASMFVVSDLAVARNRFIAPGFSNRAWGLPLYFGGQLFLALSVG